MNNAGIGSAAIQRTIHYSESLGITFRVVEEIDRGATHAMKRGVRSVLKWDILTHGDYSLVRVD